MDFAEIDKRVGTAQQSSKGMENRVHYRTSRGRKIKELLEIVKGQHANNN